MPTEVIVALIGLAQAVTLAFVGILASRLGTVKTDVKAVKADAAAARTNSAAAREQVENDHDTNMREENDSRHRETKRWLDDLRHTVTSQNATITRDIGGLREEIRIDRHTNAQRFNNIEDRIKES